MKTIKASVVIPTKNGGERFKSVINAVLSQKCPWDFELLVIDSGSKDGTVQYCLERSVPVHIIPSHEFGHGKTRNLGVSLTKGEFIAFLTQDALPADQKWLENLVYAVEQSPNVAGAFGRHFPYPDLDPFTKRDLKLLFDSFRNEPHVVQKDNNQRYQLDENYRQRLHFFSNNNSCISRKVWELYPFPDVDFAEDQIWAKTIIEAGYAKSYADKAVIYHSHNFSVIEVGRRAFDESSALHDLFGYNLCPIFFQIWLQTFRITMRDVFYALSILKNSLIVELKANFKFVLWSKNISIIGIFKSLIHIGRAVQAFVYNEKNKNLVYYSLRSLFYNLSKQIGYYFGSKGKHIPVRFLNIISFDRSLKLGKRGLPETGNEELVMVIMDVQLLQNGRPYRVAGGEKDGIIFVYESKHKRLILTMQTYYHYFSDGDLQHVTPSVYSVIPLGPPVPLNSDVSIEDLLKGDDTDAIREALCLNFHGNGYEIGAGERPTRVPLSTNISYIDKFTFDEAKDGSFIGKKPDNFVNVTFFEAMDSLESIEDGTSDFFVACHVIEHVPNVVTSLRTAFRKLKPGGEMVLVVPDKRYMFDSMRPETTLDHFLADEIKGENVETLDHYIEYFQLSAKIEDYVQVARAGFESGRDIHMHVFTPESMRLLLVHLQSKMKFTEFKVLEPLKPEILIEFYVWMKK